MIRIRRISIIKIRLAQAAERTGLSLPARVPMTFETLMEVRKKLEDHLATELVNRGKLN
jgi:hypothetical protein